MHLFIAFIVVAAAAFVAGYAFRGLIHRTIFQAGKAVLGIKAKL